MLNFTLNSLTVFLKRMWISLIIGIIAASCSDTKEEVPEKETRSPSDFESALEESKELLSLVKNDLLIMGRSSIENYIVSEELSAKNNSFRSETKLGNITLKKVFICKNNIISAVHYDFYYDSLSLSLQQDRHLILGVLQDHFGQYNAADSTGSMKRFSLKLSNTILDYELFNNGFTFTLRKKENRGLPVVIENKNPLRLELASLLINHIYNDSINFKSATADVEKLFNMPFKRKVNSLSFSEAYDEKVLLSGSFLFSGNAVSAIYFDYVYADSISKQFILDSKLIRSKVSKLYGSATEVATAAYATTYKWSKSPIIIEVYADGFSVLIEKVSL